MTGYIIKEPCEEQGINLTIDRNIFQNIEDKKYYIFCNCWDDSCMKEVDISYAIHKECCNCGNLKCQNQSRCYTHQHEHWMPKE